MEEADKRWLMTTIGVSGWMFLLVPAHPGCPSQNPQSHKMVVCNCWVIHLADDDHCRKKLIPLSRKQERKENQREVTWCVYLSAGHTGWCKNWATGCCDSKQDFTVHVLLLVLEQMLTDFYKSSGYCQETCMMLYVSWNVIWCMGNATDRVSLRSTFCISPFSRYLIHVKPTAHSKAHSCCQDWTEQNWITWKLRIASTVPAMRTGLQVSWLYYKQDLYRRSVLLMTLHIAPPTRSGQLSWWMNTNFRQWVVWARRFVYLLVCTLK